MKERSRVAEGRFGDRVSLEIPTALRTDRGHALDGMIVNADRNGAYVRTQARPSVESYVAVRPMTASSQWLEACVVRHGTDGVDLQWLDPGAALGLARGENP